MLNRVIGGYLLLVAVAVAVHTVAEPLYHTSMEGQPYSASWQILDPIMAVALVLGAVLSYLRKVNANIAAESAITREYLVANTLFFGFLFVSILFFWNWFALLSPSFTAIGPETASLVWIIVDATLPLVTGAMGVHLIRSGKS